jgi:DNA-binding response OmpR family regulator
MRLLVVEDNAHLSQLLAKGLQTVGYQTDQLATAADARAALLTTSYAALILDLGLPDSDGLSILRELRHRKDPIPVLVLTARGGLHDRVKGLRSGADDYLVKPFALEELVARLEAQLRRPGQQLGSSLHVANLEFDLRNRQASIDSRPQLLSSRETAVLELLMRTRLSSTRFHGTKTMSGSPTIICAAGRSKATISITFARPVPVAAIPRRKIATTTMLISSSIATPRSNASRAMMATSHATKPLCCGLGRRWHQYRLMKEQALSPNQARD